MMIFLFIQSSKIKTAYNTPDTTIESCLKIFFFWKIFIFIYLFVSLPSVLVGHAEAFIAAHSIFFKNCGIAGSRCGARALR